MIISSTYKHGFHKREEASMRRTLSSHLRTAMVILVSALALAGCGGSTSQHVPQVLRVGLVGSFHLNQLDPARAADKNASLIRSLIFPPLITVDQQLHLEPWAATELPSIANGGISQDGLTYTFHIRPGLRWHDGTPIDANTYAYSLNRSLDPCTLDGAAFVLYAIKGAAAFNSGTCNASKTLIGSSLLVVDDQTLRITLEHAYVYFLYQLTTPQAFAQPKQLIDQYGTTNWTSNLNGFDAGECILASSTLAQRANSTLAQRANSTLAQLASTPTPTPTPTPMPLPTATGSPPQQIVITCPSPYLPSWDSHCCDDFLLRTIYFDFYSNADTEYSAFTSGDLDVGSIPSSQYQTARTMPYFQQIPSLAIDYVQPNWSRAPFDDLRARQAFALALNKGQIANAVFQGAVTATNHIVPQGQYGYNGNLTGVKGAGTAGDTAQAKSLITAYAADNCGSDVTTCPPVTFETDNSAASLKESQAFLQMWRTAMPGYPIAIHIVDFNTLLNDVFGASSPTTVPQIFALGYSVDYPDPSDWLSLQFATYNGPNSNNVVGVTDPKAQQLMQQADTTQDTTQRASLENQAEQELVNNVAWIPIDQQMDLLGVHSYVHNYADTPLGYPSLNELFKTYLS